MIARHILEHAHDIASFLEALKGLLNPGGYLVIESPDFQRYLQDLGDRVVKTPAPAAKLVPAP